jgi:hypothetical protein
MNWLTLEGLEGEEESDRWQQSLVLPRLIAV